MNSVFVANALIQGFQDFRTGFRAFAVSGKTCFENRQWVELRAAMQQRIRLNEQSIDAGAKTAQSVPPDQTIWKGITKDFIQHFKHDTWLPLAIAYLNACLRQAYSEQSVPLIIFLPPLIGYREKTIRFDVSDNLRAGLAQAVSHPMKAFFKPSDNVLSQIIKLIQAKIGVPIQSVKMFPELFYRNKHAYAIGQIEASGEKHPLVFAYVNTDEGINLNGCLLTEAELLNVFSFSRSYFLVNCESPLGLLNFLSMVMPSKLKPQLLINLGFQELGKDLLLQRFSLQVQRSQKKFTYAPGIAGMVMIVYLHPEGEYVFKVVRNKIKPPKDTTEAEVVEKYRFVSGQDRAGRMADVQLFKNLALPADYFETPLLKELLGDSDNGNVLLQKGYVIFRNVFIERKLLPLNLYLQQHTEAENEAAIQDYGRAIKEMVMTNIFPGDMLIKNFGVGSEGRVIFYDYDEVLPLSQCVFKKLRKHRTDEEEFIGEYTEPVHEGDIFPEELVRFLVPEGKLRDSFNALHADLYSVEFWNYWKEIHTEGFFMDIQPYQPNIQ